ncbi:1,4-dihydroxy-2-naphthoate polyprenyltransferase [Corynebacterium pilosum]|uniref:1,4-dihydroxy-2-naphthoate octaprenyltransferase n=1 Tax=Corynebacterium pilosum TaxID=35756 RepID=A0A376CM41_9CORY|nr:1,4-dihydroxy-2-naphthoate polyprenyltransferase [Corynebacterium pilosum]STC69571.1 1,4-dihydroxy-2-naphthoate octaprenyltransferase [Corynebacterium pilosum]
MTTSSSASYSATRRDWWEAARPHTWANAWAPVIVGTGAAAFAGGAHFGRALLALVVAWALIIGVNFSNDYSDGIRGTDDDRTGPTRLTGSGLADPQAVKRAAFLSFGVAAVAGILLSLWSAWWFILVGAVCIAGAWFYTGGKNPYGYRGLGEVAVFVFFGLVAVLGTEYTQAGAISWVGVAAAVGTGSISASVNMANNIRDIPSDSATGKMTLAVRLGDTNARRLFAILSLVPFVMTLFIAAAYLPTLIGLIALPLALHGAITVLRGARGKDLIPVLGINGKAMLVWAIATTVALFFGALG